MFVIYLPSYDSRLLGQGGASLLMTVAPVQGTVSGVLQALSKTILNGCMIAALKNS